MTDTAYSTLPRWKLGLLPFARPWATTLAQRRSLLRFIAVAAEENVPLAEMVAAWAADESGVQRFRLRRLAERLNSGVALSDAVEQVRGVLGDEEILAIRFGVQSGVLVPTIREILRQPARGAMVRAVKLRKTLIYLVLVSIVALLLLTFLHIKIIPMMEQIFHEFELDMPRALIYVVESANLFANYWYLFALPVLGIAWLTFASWPGRRLRQRILGDAFGPQRDRRIGDVLQNLSVASDAGRPIAGALSTLARYHYDPRLRNELLFVRNEMEHGADVWETMARRGLLDSPEVRALAASERTGNRSWTLQQLARVRQRRTDRTMARWVEAAMPLAVILLGFVVLFHALGIFSPLVRLVEALGM